MLVLNLELDNEGKLCLQRFNDLRNQLGKDLNILIEPLPQSLPNFTDIKTENISDELARASATGQSNTSSHDILLAEADAILALAEELSQEGLRFEAMLNYHTAAVFYRVLMSMVRNVVES